MPRTPLLPLAPGAPQDITALQERQDVHETLDPHFLLDLHASQLRRVSLDLRPLRPKHGTPFFSAKQAFLLTHGPKSALSRLDLL